MLYLLGSQLKSTEAGLYGTMSKDLLDIIVLGKDNSKGLIEYDLKEFKSADSLTILHAVELFSNLMTLSGSNNSSDMLNRRNLPFVKVYLPKGAMIYKYADLLKITKLTIKTKYNDQNEKYYLVFVDVEDILTELVFFKKDFDMLRRFENKVAFPMPKHDDRYLVFEPVVKVGNNITTYISIGNSIDYHTILNFPKDPGFFDIIPTELFEVIEEEIFGKSPLLERFREIVKLERLLSLNEYDLRIISEDGDELELSSELRNIGFKSICYKDTMSIPFGLNKFRIDGRTIILFQDSIRKEIEFSVYDAIIHLIDVVDDYRIKLNSAKDLDNDNVRRMVNSYNSWKKIITDTHDFIIKNNISIEGPESVKL